MYFRKVMLLAIFCSCSNGNNLALENPDPNLRTTAALASKLPFSEGVYLYQGDLQDVLNPTRYDYDFANLAASYLEITGHTVILSNTNIDSAFQIELTASSIDSLSYRFLYYFSSAYEVTETAEIGSIYMLYYSAGTSVVRQISRLPSSVVALPLAFDKVADGVASVFVANESILDFELLPGQDEDLIIMYTPTACDKESLRSKTNFLPSFSCVPIIPEYKLAPDASNLNGIDCGKVPSKCAILYE